MIAVTDYTSYAEIRAALGVSSYELPDATLALPMYAQYLQLRLRETTGTFSETTGSLIDIFEALDAEGFPTDAEEDFFLLIKQFATYTVAEACLSGLSLLAMKTESDGKTTQTRFSAEATFKDVAMNVRQTLNSLAAQIEQALTGAASTASLPMLNRVPPAIDVVTNESA